MKKLLRLTNSILDYRLPVYNELANHYDLTVAHYGTLIQSDRTNFKQVILHPKKIGSFVFFKENIFNLAQQYDAVLVMGDLHVLPYIMLGLRLKRNFALTFWGGDVSFSYTKHYDEDRRFDKIRFYLMNRADSLVFYCSYPISRYVNDGGVNPAKLFVANNTVHVPERIAIPKVKKYFLFVGTLYKAKKIFDLLEAYSSAHLKNMNIQPLIIVGDGDAVKSMQAWIDEHKLNEKIILKGAIYEQKILETIFQDAIACISPGQAGLSVLSSMAYGVPFVTSKNAFTGGEIFNITDEENGFLYDGSVEKLSSIISRLSNDNDEVNRLSVNAQRFYFENASLPVMVKGLCDSIEYSLQKHTNLS